MKTIVAGCKLLFVGLLFSPTFIPAWSMVGSLFLHDDSAKEFHRTPLGVRFGLLGNKQSFPAPTVFFFATSIDQSLNTSGLSTDARLLRFLIKRGVLCVSLDLPCHGSDARQEEPKELYGWAARMRKGEDFLPRFVKNLSAVLDYLIKEGYADRRRIGAAGSSRGGFIALHFAAAEPRVKCIATFAPVTHLPALSEFAGMQNHELAKSRSVINLVNSLTGRDVWIAIGNNDRRVDTDYCVAFTRQLVQAATANRQTAKVELHVLPVDDHACCPSYAEEAARWILGNIGSHQ